MTVPPACLPAGAQEGLAVLEVAEVPPLLLHKKIILKRKGGKGEGGEKLFPHELLYEWNSRRERQIPCICSFVNSKVSKRSQVCLFIYVYVCMYILKHINLN